MVNVLAWLPHGSRAHRGSPVVTGSPTCSTRGCRSSECEALLQVCGPYIDVWKLGWGTAYLDPGLAREARPARASTACWPAPAARCSRSPGNRAWWTSTWTGPTAAGFPCVEVSCGAVTMSEAQKRALIGPAAQRFVVLGEIGAKDPRVEVTAAAWALAAAADLDAGATWVVTEGRESGTVGSVRPGRRGARRRRGGGGRRDRCRRHGVRGAPQGPAGLADPPLRPRRQPRQRGTGRGARRWRRCASGCAPTRSTARREPDEQPMSRFPDRYREVSVTDVDVPLEIDAAARAAHLAPGLPPHAVHRRAHEVTRPPWSRSARRRRRRCSATWQTSRCWPGRTRRRTCTARTSTPGSRASCVKAAADAPDARCVVVEGRYGHVSFVLDPTPVRLHVLDVAPPWPAKLVDQVERVLQTAEDLPGVLPVPHVVELSSLLPAAPSGHYLLPCRGGGMDVPGATVSLPRRGAAPRRTGRCSAAPGRGPSTTSCTTGRSRRSTPARAPSPATSTYRPARCC